MFASDGAGLSPGAGPPARSGAQVKVRDLIVALAAMPPDMQVMVASPGIEGSLTIVRGLESGPLTATVKASGVRVVILMPEGSMGRVAVKDGAGYSREEW